MMKARAKSVAHKPLQGKRIVLTRAVEQATELDHALTDAGASVILLPCVEFAVPRDSAPLEAAISRIGEFDWLVFTSPNAIRFFRQREGEIGGDRSLVASGPPGIAAFGKATAQAAAQAGYRVDFVAAQARSGSEFVSAFAPLARGKKMLLPQSDHAGDQIPTALREAGANVTSVVAYRTCVPESLDSDILALIRRDGADMIFFSSPSAFRNFAKLVGEQTMTRLAGNSAFGAIGPTTAGAMRASGAAVAFESPQPSSGAIVNSMAEYFARKSLAKAHS
jgi:uroporphyrinogen III methyltransferase/synthase